MDTHWRNSMKPARFFFLDARAAVPFVIAMLHLRWYTLVLAAITTLIFYFLEVRGLNFFAALRALRVWLVTRKRPNIRHSDLHRWTDYAFEDTEKQMIRMGARPVEIQDEPRFDLEKPTESTMKLVKRAVKKVQKKMVKPAPHSPAPAVAGKVKGNAGKTVLPAGKKPAPESRPAKK